MAKPVRPKNYERPGRRQQEASTPDLRREAADRADRRDIHAETAQELFGEVTPDTRARAKTINYIETYGVSGKLGDLLA